MILPIRNTRPASPSLPFPSTFCPSLFQNLHFLFPLLSTVRTTPASSSPTLSLASDFKFPTMLKLSHILRNAGSEELLTGKARKTVNALYAHNFTSQTAYTGNPTTKIFNDYTVFKGKAALSVCPLLPKLNQTENSSKYDKKGCILLKFWPAIGERKYNWEKRQIFALSPTELGSLISLESGKSCEFFHDPFMKSSNAGQIKKSLTVSPMGKDDGGYFFSLNVVNGIQDTNERFSVPVSKAEFTVMRTAFSYILPHIMGWDQAVRQEQPSNGMNQGRQQASPKYEWDR